MPYACISHILDLENFCISYLLPYYVSRSYSNEFALLNSISRYYILFFLIVNNVHQSLYSGNMYLVSILNLGVEEIITSINFVI